MGTSCHRQQQNTLRSSCTIFGFSWYILIKVSLVKFHDIPRSESCADMCRQMDGHTWQR